MAGWAFSLHWFCVQHKHTQRDTHIHACSKQGQRTFKCMFRGNMHVPQPAFWKTGSMYLNSDAGKSAWLPSFCGLILSLMPVGHLTTFPYWACSEFLRLSLQEADKLCVFISLGEMRLNSIPSLCKIIEPVLPLAWEPILAHRQRRT